ncbi:MAG: Aldehyde dehydrogenase [Bradyrhizobium sp.]|nr:Aldehyde dehydrogenase [Bradyrhizobium sp.]
MSAARTLEVTNPANGTTVGLMPLATEADLNAAVGAAQSDLVEWSATSDEERQEACRAIAAKIADHAEELARILTLEQGKPLNGKGSRFEIEAARAWTAFTAELTLPVEILQDDAQGRIELHRKPIGVVPRDDELGAAISSHTGIQKIVFTGCTATGKKIMASSSSSLKRLTLEFAEKLGGEFR